MITLTKHPLAGKTMPESAMQLNYGAAYPHEFIGNTADEINRLEAETARLEQSIREGAPARRRQPTIDDNKKIIAALRSI